MSIRTDRVSRMIQREVAELLQNEFHEASHSLLTITGVRMTKDLGVAYVDVSVFGEEPDQRNAAFKRLESHTIQIRQALAQRIRHQVRRIPEIRFFLDESQHHAARIEELFAKIHAGSGDGGVKENESEESSEVPT